MLAPGYSLIWIGAAAGVTGVLTGVLAIGWQMQVLIFTLLAVAAVMASRRYMASHPIASDDDNLNRRANRMIGETVIVVEAITGGQGKVKVGDSPWIAKGPDAPVGTMMRVTRVDGSWLIVDRV